MQRINDLKFLHHCLNNWSALCGGKKDANFLVHEDMLCLILDWAFPIKIDKANVYIHRQERVNYFGGHKEAEVMHKSRVLHLDFWQDEQTYLIIQVVDLTKENFLVDLQYSSNLKCMEVYS